MQTTGAIIVAGGGSTRLGQDKRRLRLWGEGGPTLLEHTLQVAAALCDETIVVLNDPEAWPDLPALLVRDEQLGAGPLAGLAAGLAALRAPRAMVLSADLPLLSPALLRAMLSYDTDAEALIPRREGESGPRNARALEPLHAIYAATCLPAIRACLARDDRRLIAFLDAVQVEELPPSWWTRHDPQGRSFLNINTPEQLAQVQGLLAADR